jgi:hypothetical protein
MTRISQLRDRARNLESGRDGSGRRREETACQSPSDMGKRDYVKHFQSGHQAHDHRCTDGLAAHWDFNHSVFLLPIQS